MSLYQKVDLDTSVAKKIHASAYKKMLSHPAPPRGPSEDLSRN